MPFTTNSDVRIHWALDGDDDKPAVVLLNSIGTDMSLWDDVLPFLRSSFHLLRIDTRGHGQSDAPKGDYSLRLLAEDIAAVMDDVGIPRAAVAGVSLGGMMAMELALKYPARVSALALICTSAAMDKASWETRIETVRREGTQAIAGMAVGRFLSAPFAASHPQVVARMQHSIEAQADDGYAGAGAAIRDMALLDRLFAIHAPALVITGAADISTPFSGHGDILVSRIPEAQHREVEGAHLPPIEAPEALAAALKSFFAPS
jgi:3-oxoadipate enol-lactonase / 4-carboxymuconolactone decarboxylase